LTVVGRNNDADAGITPHGFLTAQLSGYMQERLNSIGIAKDMSVLHLRCVTLSV
jgi:hypothetical protein